MLCSRKLPLLAVQLVSSIVIVVCICTLYSIVLSSYLLHEHQDEDLQHNEHCTPSSDLRFTQSLQSLRCIDNQHLFKINGSSKGKDMAFFVETSNSTTLNFRQACAIESLAMLNPTLAIYLLKAGPDLDKKSDVLKTLTENYANVNIVKIDLIEFFANTPLEQWFHSNEMQNERGPYWVSHLSDALRFLVLYEFGGYYFDLDVIQLKQVSHYKNFAALETPSYLGSSAMHIECNHPVAEMAINDFRKNYRSDIWGYNGPLLITRVLQKWCKSKKLMKMNFVNCLGFNVLPPSSFYPIHNSKWDILFSPVKEVVSRKLFNHQVIGVHAWNNLNSREPLEKHSNQLYVRVMKEKCPAIFSKAPEIF